MQNKIVMMMPMTNCVPDFLLNKADRTQYSTAPTIRIVKFSERNTPLALPTAIAASLPIK